MLSSCLHRNAHHGRDEIFPIACTQRSWQLMLPSSAPPLCWSLAGSTSAGQSRDLLLAGGEDCLAHGLRW